MTQPTSTDPSEWETDDDDRPKRPAATLAIPIVVLIAVAALVVGLAGGFLIERSRIKHTTSVAATAPRVQTATPKGTVSALSGSKMTVQTGQGRTVTVIFNSGTLVHKGTSAQTTDLASGQKVEIVGQTQADGTITAKRIVIVTS